MKLLLSSILTLLLASAIAGQNPLCDHTSDSEERFSWMRIKPPIEVRFFNGHQIDYALGKVIYHDRQGLTVDASTVQHDDFARKYAEGKWWVIFCARPTGRKVNGRPEICNHVYVVTKVLPQQIQNGRVSL